MPTEAARDIASRVGLDLVEIAGNAQPPVCKIMDYGRYKYELKKKAGVAKKSQHRTQVKEIKLRPRIEDHDLDFKLKRARQFLIDGDKVKCTVMFRGREIIHTGRGRIVLNRVAEQLEGVAKVEQTPRLENRQMSLILTPDRPAIDKMLKKQKQEQKQEQEQEQEHDQDAEAPVEGSEETESAKA